jgi:Fe-S-cluster-containing hydrogenase component 2
VSDTCFGCGLCAINCPEKAIVMKQKSETKERIQDYLIGLNLDI